jgi:putative DNA methylase
MAGRIGVRLLAIVAEGIRSRVYLKPTAEHEALAATARPEWEPEGDLPNDPRNFWTVQYGLSTFASLFTPRQLVALTTFSDLVGETREKVLADAPAAGLKVQGASLNSGGAGAVAYADAVVTYLGLAVSKLSDAQSSLARWKPSMDQTIATFGRHALPMVWDYAESNAFSGMAGDFGVTLNNMLRVLTESDRIAIGAIYYIDAAKNSFPVLPIVIATDPPYYDNIAYADLSDFFYVWLKRSLSGIWPDLFRRLTTPKAEELVATPYRHGGKEEAEAFFMRGMSEALTAMREAATDYEPLAIYYAFKQSELAEEGIVSAGWASFLRAVVDAGLAVDGTWPVRTELANRMIARDANALASSIVLVCRKRAIDAATITRAEFIRTLKRDLPEGIDDIRKAGVGPVDMQQSVIGPGMGVFTRYAKVLEDDYTAMTVKAALAAINRV